MNGTRRAKDGASMIIALILLIVFLVIGTSVLTAASASVGRAAALREEKQLYYFARSVASTFTEGMTDLWGTVWGPVNKMLEADREGEKTEYSYHCTVSVQNLSQDGVPDDFLSEDGTRLNMEPVALTAEGVRFDENGTLYSVGKLTAAFHVQYKSRDYQLVAEYTYQKPEDGDAETGWTLVKYGRP